MIFIKVIDHLYRPRGSLHHTQQRIGRHPFATGFSGPLESKFTHAIVTDHGNYGAGLEANHFKRY